MKPKGAGYELEKINLITSTDSWFRPSDVCVAPDGSVFVASAYPRDIPGVPRERNLNGISFAVANMTGFVARAKEMARTASVAQLKRLLVEEATRE